MRSVPTYFGTKSTRTVFFPRCFENIGHIRNKRTYKESMKTGKSNQSRNIWWKYGRIGKIWGNQENKKNEEILKIGKTTATPIRQVSCDLGVALSTGKSSAFV